MEQTLRILDELAKCRFREQGSLLRLIRSDEPTVVAGLVDLHRYMTEQLPSVVADMEARALVSDRNGDQGKLGLANVLEYGIKEIELRRAFSAEDGPANAIMIAQQADIFAYSIDANEWHAWAREQAIKVRDALLELSRSAYQRVAEADEVRP